MVQSIEVLVTNAAPLKLFNSTISGKGYPVSIQFQTTLDELSTITLFAVNDNQEVDSGAVYYWEGTHLNC